MHQLATVGPVPVLCGSLWQSRREALATPNAHLELAGCGQCAHAWNWRFDPALVEYDAQYDNALDFSPTFRAYAESLAGCLVDTFDLHDKTIVEIGSGKGEFLRELCASGRNRGVGYDPTFEGPDREGDIEFVREFFTSDTAPDDIDFVCCRHVLEHLADPYQFLTDIRAAVKDEPVSMYFEVPNAEFNFAETGPWDLIYPHVAYFSDTSLRALLERAGFRVNRLGSSFNGQFLSAEVVVDPAAAGDGWWDTDRGAELAKSYTSAIGRQLTELGNWQARLSGLQERGPVGLWGAGSKGVTFLSLVDVAGLVEAVVDVNPRKWGRFLPGGGHEIVEPTRVATQRVGTVLVMNPAYTNEIQHQVDAMDSQAEIVLI